MKIKDGYIDFKGFKTYYRIVNPDGKKTPLLFLHGGPGSTHVGYTILDSLAEKDDRPFVMYDQIGCGKSMITGHPELFTSETWLDELETVRKELKLDEVHILGHSWGGMLAITYEIERKPNGVKSYILSSTLHSSELWKIEQHRYLTYMPKEMQDAIKIADELNDYDKEDYKKAVDEYMLRHCAPKITEEYPACLRQEKIRGKEAYVVAWGPNEFTPTGNLKDYDYTNRMDEIVHPCLILSGQMDSCTPYIAKELFDNIKDSKWVLFQYSRHVSYIEETQKYMDSIEAWMNEKD